MITLACIALVCSAPLSPTLKSRIDSFPFIAAVDGGANHCRALGITPQLLIGDFDSIDPETLRYFSAVPQERHPREKDQTDLELAISALCRPDVKEIVVFGALQGRTDHLVGNLVLLSRYPGKVFLESEHEKMFVIDKETEFATYPGQTISLIPLNGPATGIDTQGLKWPLANGTLDKQFIGISNEATGPLVRISVKEGDLLCCINL